jgi:hypothetical protein
MCYLKSRGTGTKKGRGGDMFKKGDAMVPEVVIV